MSKMNKLEAITLCVMISIVLIGFAAVPAQAQQQWYWKPSYIDYAPSGLPDFDQRQDAWRDPLSGRWTYCGPTAIANSLWWLDSEFETGTTPPPTVSDHYPLVQNYTAGIDDHDPSNVPPFIQELATLMNTGINNGTEVHDMEKGIEALLSKKGLTNKLYEITVKMPTLDFVLREFEKCEDVVLLLGFWQYQAPGIWVRTGGHYVTVAGIGFDTMGNTWVAFSDPMQDNAEPPPRGNNGPGQVLPIPLHPPHATPGGETLHNNASYVSHDGYMAALSQSPGGLWGFPFYENWTIFQNCQGQNTPVEFMKNTGPMQQLAVYVEVEYAVVTSPWFEKPPYPDYAPSSVPDFDQKQDAWLDPTGLQWTYCGPTAIANSLWWLDSEFETGTTPPPTVSDHFPLVKNFTAGIDDHDPSNVDPFIKRLAYLMDTDGQRTLVLPHSGTNIMDMQAGIAQYLSETGVNPRGDCNGDGVVTNDTDLAIVWAAYGSKPGDPNWDMCADVYIDNKIDAKDLTIVSNNLGKGGKFYEKTVKTPDPNYIEDEVKKCEDVILLLGFWQEIAPQYWIRVGGHYVTVTGVDSLDMLFSFSDPFFNNAESGGYGRVIPPSSHGHTGPPETIHNNATFVSHDYYFAVGTNSPGGFWGPEKYNETVGSYLDNFIEQNVPKEFESQQGYLPGLPVSVEVEYAVVVSCRTGIAVAGSEDKNVYAFDFDGRLLWTALTVAPVQSVAVDNEANYVVAGSRALLPIVSALYFYDNVGTLKWSKDLRISESYDGGWAGEESKSVDVKYNYYNQCDIVAAAHDGGLNLYDQLGNLIWAYTDQYPETIVRISQDGNYIVCASHIGPGAQMGVHYFSHLRDGVPGWGPADGSPIWTYYMLDTGGVFWVAISGLGDFVAVSGWFTKPITSYVTLLDRTGSTIWLDSYAASGGKSGYVRLDMPCSGTSVVAVNDDPDAVGCQLRYYSVAGGLSAGWDSGDGTPDWIYTPPGPSPNDDFYSVAISGNGDIIATGPTTANSIYVLKSDSTLLQTIADGVMQSVDLTYNGKYGVEGDNNGKIWFFTKDSNSPLWTYQTGGQAWIHSVAISKIYPCMFPYPNHDVDVTNITRYRTSDGKVKTIVCQGYPSMEINITLSNHGDFTETVEVRLYAYSPSNNTLVLVGSKTVTLNPGTNPVISMNWTSTNVPYYGNYTLIASIGPVQDEINVYDNEFVDCNFLIVGLGDIDPNRWVEMKDIRPIAKAFDKYPGDPVYHPNCDLSGDYYIDMKDIRPAAKAFNAVYP